MRCPYCGAGNPTLTIEQTRSSSWSFKIYKHSTSTSANTQSMKVSCKLCQQRYEILDVDDYSWIRSKISILSTAIEAFKTIYGLPAVTLDDIFAAATAVTIPDRMARHNKLHICFNLQGTRSFMDCVRDGSMLKGVSVVRS